LKTNRDAGPDRFGIRSWRVLRPRRRAELCSRLTYPKERAEESVLHVIHRGHIMPRWRTVRYI
jgi:hypothetical protein